MQRQDSFAMQDNEDEEEVSFQASGKSESEEEDYENFFLQPASCPYNIKEKILEANAQLIQESLNENKENRIQFRSNLVDFEPDLTDDDVQSIESYSEEVINVNEELKYVLDNKLCNIEEEIIEESIFESIIELNHQKQCEEAEREEAEKDKRDKAEKHQAEREEAVREKSERNEAESDEEREESEGDEVESEVEEDENYASTEDTEEINVIKNVGEIKEVIALENKENIEENDENEEIIETLDIIEDEISEDEIEIDSLEEIIDECPAVPQDNPIFCESEEVKTSSVSEASNSDLPTSKETHQKIKTKKKNKLPHEISCKKHCIEELESRLEMCINRFRLNDNVSKPVCPTLRLHRQKCCAGGCKIEQKLPLYTGTHSEYGLSSIQIERLERRRESSKLRAQREHVLSEAYRRRKVQQNEIIFRQWLRDISARRHVERRREKEIIRQADSRKRKLYSCSSSGGSTQRTTARIDSKEKMEKLEQEKQASKRQIKARPKTANYITQLSVANVGKTVVTKQKKIRGRPKTSSSSARIFIEIPERLLDEGISLGELFLRQLDLNEKVKSKERLQMVTKVK